MVNRHSYGTPRLDKIFYFAVSLDNGLLRQSVAIREAVPIGKILSLAAAAQ
jgi:hypothetical protein